MGNCACTTVVVIELSQSMAGIAWVPPEPTERGQGALEGERQQVRGHFYFESCRMSLIKGF